MIDRLPAPTTLHGMAKTAAQLGTDRRSTERLARAGLLGEIFTTDSGLAVRPEAVGPFAARPHVGSHGPLIVLRLAPAAPSGETETDRAWVGWHETLAHEAWPQQLAAIDRWWAIRNVERGHQIAYTLAGFIVHVAEVAAVHPGPGGLKKLDLTNADPATQELLHHWLPTGRGGNVVQLAAKD